MWAGGVGGGALCIGWGSGGGGCSGFSRVVVSGGRGRLVCFGAGVSVPHSNCEITLCVRNACYHFTIYEILSFFQLLRRIKHPRLFS